MCDRKRSKRSTLTDFCQPREPRGWWPPPRDGQEPPWIWRGCWGDRGRAQPPHWCIWNPQNGTCEPSAVYSKPSDQCQFAKSMPELLDSTRTSQRCPSQTRAPRRIQVHKCLEQATFYPLIRRKVLSRFHPNRSEAPQRSDAGWYLSRCHFPPECRRSGAENTASKVFKSSTNEPPPGTGATQLAKLGILKRAKPSPLGSKAGWEASNWTSCSSSMFQRSIETQMFPWWKLMVYHSPKS